MKFLGALYSALALSPCVTYAFAPHVERASALRQKQDESRASPLASSRRDFFETALQTTALGTAALVSMPSQEAWASGGATAGGAYLLSAKQRYNDRVQQGVKGYLGVQSLLESGDINALRAYFSNEDTGGWKDLTAAGYLLANAFRRNSTAAPDSLPSVKAWKKFAASVEAITKALKKKDTKAALTTYKDSLVLLDEYLKQVELPEAKEISLS